MAEGADGCFVHLLESDPWPLTLAPSHLQYYTVIKCMYCWAGEHRRRTNGVWRRLLGQNPSWRVQRTADTWLRHVGSWQRECNQHGWLGVTKWSIWPFSSTQPEKQDRNQRASKCLSAPVPTTKGTPVCDRQSTNFLTFLNSIESYSQQTRSTGLWNQTRQRYHFKTTLLETLMQGQPVDGRSFKKQVKNIRCCRWNQVSFFLRQCRSNFSGLGELYVHDWQATL